MAIQTADDAAVYRLRDDLALIVTLDFFTPIVDDPYWFGAIAAANALSDVYAMGATPLLALNVVAFPRNHPDLPLTVLGRILQGGAEKARQAGIAILGGHSIDDPEPKYGLVVIGQAQPDHIWRNVGARPGDALVLTKPLGTGIITTALRKGAAPDIAIQKAIDTMAALNDTAARIARSFSVHACTDVTGFGLLGHLREMLAADPVGAVVQVSRVPVLEQTRELAQGGAVPGGTRRNLESVRPALDVAPNVDELSLLVLADAQTSGGLVLALPEKEAEACVQHMRQHDIPAAVIGRIVEDVRHAIRLEP